jgi:hypothetical protein
MSKVSGGYDFDFFFLLPGLTKIYRWKKKTIYTYKKIKGWEANVVYFNFYIQNILGDLAHIVKCK